VIDAPPLDGRARIRRWTTDLAKKYVGQRPDRPETPAQKAPAEVVADDTARHLVNKAQTMRHKSEIGQDLITDNQVAAQVASDVLRRPEVAARVVADDTARHAVLLRVPGRRDGVAPAAGS